ncbi:hypothetical protein ACIRP0_27545 [Streptomyces sp. NPDC101733]|uniref:hypothetical protein n=1 Tax=unclassified Streptomyces TaxID=2593676 RepID=UPI003820F8C9
MRALEVMEPFVATGWRTARSAKARILLRAARTDEALDLVRLDEEEHASQIGCRSVAELQAKAGYVDEGIDLLVPHIGEPWIQTALVEITEGQDRDERVLELIAPYAETARRVRDEGRSDYSLSDAHELHAQGLERAGRADEAIRFLGEVMVGRCSSQNTLTFYAELPHAKAGSTSCASRPRDKTRASSCPPTPAPCESMAGLRKPRR